MNNILNPTSMDISKIASQMTFKTDEEYSDMVSNFSQFDYMVARVVQLVSPNGNTIDYPVNTVESLNRILNSETDNNISNVYVVKHAYEMNYDIQF